jgi:hypothetical protein
VNQNDIDLDWSAVVAGLIVEELIAGKVMGEHDRQFAEKITSQQIHVMLVSGMRPDANNRRYQPGGVGFKPESN